MSGIRTTAQWILLVFGVAYLLAGIAGYIDALVTPGVDGESLLFGTFAVDGVHNIVHLVIGGLAIVAALQLEAARWISRVLGVVFLVVALWGFGLVGAAGDRSAMLAGLFHVNAADNWLHLASAVLTLVLGFAPYGWRERSLAERVFSR